MKPLITITLVFLSVASFIGCKKDPTIRVTHLSCEYFTDPQGIDAKAPQLSWQLESDQRGQKQTAYRLLVASSRQRLAKDEGDLWDSGKVESDQSRHVAYKGTPLHSRMECFWKVRTWDKDGTPSAWSEPAYWSMGLLEKEDWTAQWIGSPDSVTAPYYRHSFHLDDVPERAPIYLAALGYFELFINGEKVGKEVLAPAVSNFNERSYYQTYDVAGYLKKGKNSIGIWMGTGWYSPGLPGVKHHSPVVRAQLEIPGETNQRIVTDTSWESKASARSLIGEWRWGKFGGELLDARLIDRQWWNEESSINNWKPVVIVEASDVPCTAQLCRNNIQLDEIAPVSIELLDDTTVLVDFGTNLTGMLKMKFRNLDAGQKVTIHYADLDGRAPEEAWRLNMAHKGFATYNQRDEFISAGEEDEQFMNVFNYHGYRYALIEGLSYIPKKEDLVAIPVETEVPESGSFTCSNDLYNAHTPYGSMDLSGLKPGGADRRLSASGTSWLWRWTNCHGCWVLQFRCVHPLHQVVTKLVGRAERRWFCPLCCTNSAWNRWRTGMGGHEYCGSVENLPLLQGHEASSKPGIRI